MNKLSPELTTIIRNIPIITPVRLRESARTVFWSKTQTKIGKRENGKFFWVGRRFTPTAEELI